MAKTTKIQIITLAIFCILIQIIPLVKSGLTYTFGIGFWGAMGHDGVWHLSLTSGITDPLKLSLPMFHNVPLQGYHPFYNILIKTIGQITNIPINYLIFQLFPLISATIFVYLSYRLGYILTKSKLGGVLLMFLNSTANSLGWLVSLLRGQGLEGESMFWAMQSPSNQINPPFQLSLLLILWLFTILSTLRKPQDISLSKIFQIILVLILLPITKVYSAPVGFGLLFFFSAYYYYKFQTLLPTKIFFISLILSSGVFYLYNPSSYSLVSFQPFWFLNSLIESPDRLYIPYLANMRYTLESTNSIGPRLIALYIFTFITFIVGNFGLRTLSIFTPPRYRLLNSVLLFLTVITILVPTLFIQKGTPWNTIQFMYYGLFLSNISLTLFLTSTGFKYKKGLVFLVIISSLIPLFGSIPQYIGSNPPTAIPPEEIKALQYLSTLPKGIILTAPYDSYQKINFAKTPLPLYVYETTSYVSAYSSQATFLEDEMNLGNSGIDYLPSLKASQKFFEQKNIFEDRGFLVNNQISYIYLPGLQRTKYNLTSPELSLKPIYDKGDVLIYQVLR